MKRKIPKVVLLFVVIIFTAGCISKEIEKNEINISNNDLQKNITPNTTTIQQIEPKIIETTIPTPIKEKKTEDTVRIPIESNFYPLDVKSVKEVKGEPLNQLHQVLSSRGCYIIFVQTKDLELLQPISYKYATSITYSSRDASEGYTNYEYAEYSNFKFVKYKDNTILYADVESSFYHVKSISIDVFDKLPQPPFTPEKPFGNATWLNSGHGKFPDIELGKKNTVVFAEFEKMPPKESILRIEMGC